MYLHPVLYPHGKLPRSGRSLPSYMVSSHKTVDFEGCMRKLILPLHSEVITVLSGLQQYDRIQSCCAPCAYFNGTVQGGLWHLILNVQFGYNLYDCE